MPSLDEEEPDEADQQVGASGEILLFVRLGRGENVTKSFPGIC